MFDRCGASRKKAKKQPLVPKLFLNGQLAPGTTVSSFNNGRKYKVSDRERKNGGGGKRDEGG